MNKIEERLRLLSAEDSNFNQNVIVIRRVWQIPIKGFDEYKDGIKWLFRLHKKDYEWGLFMMEVYNLNFITELSYNYTETVAYYILFNKFLPPTNGVSISFNENEDSLILDVRAQATEKDLLKAWKIAKLKQKELSDYEGKYRPIKDINLYEDIYNKKKEGCSYKEIAEYVGNGATATDVADWVRKYKKKADIIDSVNGL